MPNNIPDEQNSATAIDLLRASRGIYKDAKAIGEWQLFLSMSSAVGGTVLSAFFPITKAWVGLYGAVALLIDVIFLEPVAKAKQEIGARIQEKFDTQLYHMEWNRAKVGPSPDHETLVDLANRHRAAHPNQKPLEDWYPVAVGQLPLEYARFVCQRANMRWDSALRRTYCSIYLIILVAMWVVGGIYALAAQYDMERFVLSVVVPLLPASVQLWRQRKRQEDSARDSERAKEYLENLWSDAIQHNRSPEELGREARVLQDEIFDRRRRSPAIPDLLYSRKREEYEEQMKQASAAMVNDVLKKLG